MLELKRPFKLLRILETFGQIDRVRSVQRSTNGHFECRDTRRTFDWISKKHTLSVSRFQVALAGTIWKSITTKLLPKKDLFKPVLTDANLLSSSYRTPCFETRINSSSADRHCSSRPNVHHFRSEPFDRANAAQLRSTTRQCSNRKAMKSQPYQNLWTVPDEPGEWPAIMREN